MHQDGSLIVTPRLILQRMTVGEMNTLFAEPEAPSLWKDRPFTNPHRVLMDDPGPLRFRVELVEKDASKMFWLMRWIIEKDSRQIIGHTSFHDSPDADGMIEIGITIVEEYRGQGFAKEALRAMWTWAVSQPEVKMLRYTVSPDNAPSVAIITSFGFTRIGQQIDEEDGPEDIYEMEAAAFVSRS